MWRSPAPASSSRSTCRCAITTAPRGRDGLHSYAQPSRFLCPSVRRHLDTVYAGHIEVAPATHDQSATASVSADLDALWA